LIESVGQYRLLEQVGRGPAGDVFRARDTRAGRTVTLRVFPAHLSAATDEGRRFLDAASEAAALSHPNIAAVYECGESAEFGGRLFMASEFLSGQTIAFLVAGTPIQPRRALDLAAQLADALADAHAAGIRDGHISAETVIVTQKGNAKLVDVGLARWTGTPGEARVAASDRADIQAVGEVLYHMLVGRAPLKKAPAPPSRLNAAVPRELDEVVLRALGTVPQPYEAAATFAAELRAVGAVLDVRATPEAPVGEASSGRATALVVVAVLAAIAAVAAWWLLRRPAS